MATEPDEIVQNVVVNENEKSIELFPRSKGKKRSLRPSRCTNKNKHMATNKALVTMKDIQAGKSVRDQYALFGEQVGMQIRDLPLPHTRKVVRQIISTVLFEAEMGQYDYPPITSSRPHPAGAHFKPPDSRVPMYARFSTPIPDNSTFHQPFPTPNQVSTPGLNCQRTMVSCSSASFTDDPAETTDSDSIDNLLMEL